MTKRRNGLPAHCTIATDRHGKKRVRFRAGGIDIYLPFPPTGQEFTDAYGKALAGVQGWRSNIGQVRTKPGTFNALAVSYYRSPEFTGQRPVTQHTYRLIIERFREKHGHRLLKDLRRDHIKTIIGGMSATPTAANRLLSLLKIMLRIAFDNEWIVADPSRGVKGFPKKTDGFHSWTDDEITAFEETHPAGTKARLAYSLLIYTAQRRGDVIRMGWRDIKNGRIYVKQSKTGVELDLFIHPILLSELELLPKDRETFLQTEFKKPFTAAGFGNWFRDRCDEAGLTNCSAHGLRKAASRIMAEAGKSADTIKSVTGHTNLQTVSIYTNAANQAKLADQGIASIHPIQIPPTLSNLSDKVGQNEEQDHENKG
jgi:integrase